MRRCLAVLEVKTTLDETLYMINPDLWSLTLPEDKLQNAFLPKMWTVDLLPSLSIEGSSSLPV